MDNTAPEWGPSSGGIVGMLASAEAAGFLDEAQPNTPEKSPPHVAQPAASVEARRQPTPVRATSRPACKIRGVAC